MPGPNSGGICHVDGCTRHGETLIEFGRQESQGDGHHRALLCEYHTGAMYDYFEEIGVPAPAFGVAPRPTIFAPGARPRRFPTPKREFRE